MGQIEIYDYLKAQRSSGNEEYFTARQIQKELNHNCRVYGALIQLETYGYLEVKRTGKIHDWSRAYRLKKKFL